MKTIYLVLLIFWCSIIFPQQQQDIPWPSLANTTCPMIHVNPQSNGRINVIGPETLDTLWIKDLPNGIFSGPVIGYNDNLYFGSYFWYSDSFYSFSKEGKLNWVFSPGTGAWPHMASHGGIIIGADSTIYYGADDGYLYALNSDGALKWKYNSGAVIDPQIILNIDLEGSLYFTNGTGYLYAVRNDGTLKWSVLYDEGFKLNSASFSPDGSTLYIPGNTDDLYAIDTSGTLKWKYVCKKNNRIPVVDFQGNIYIIPGAINDTTRLLSINNTGQLNWEHKIVRNDLQVNSAPAIDYDGNIYFFSMGISGQSARSIESVDYWGNFRWKFALREHDQITDNIAQPLICDKKGNLFFGGTDGYSYYAVNSEGMGLWLLPIEFLTHQVDNTSALGSDGTLYFGTHRSKYGGDNYQNLFAIRSNVSHVNENAPVKIFSLSQNYPNPFNPTTTIQFTIEQRGKVSLSVYDILGREVKKFVDEEKEPGVYKVNFNGSRLSSGVYIYRLQSGEKAISRKFILLK